VRIPTLVQILKSLGVALLVTGILYGAALGWSPDQGLRALWLATAVAVASTVVGLLASAALRDIGSRPRGAPTAFRVGLGGGWALMLLLSTLVLLAGLAAPAPYVVWLVLHAGAQLALHALAFRKEDADEMARGTHLDAGMTR